MPESPKILGQAATVSGYITPYDTPDNAQAVISAITIHNPSTTTTGTVSIHARLNGAVASNNNILFQSLSIAPQELVEIDPGIAFGPNDQLSIWSGLAGMHVCVFGVEIT